MIDWIHSQTLLPADCWILLLALFGAMCIGLSKSGLAGTATLNVVIMAKIFGAKPSVGIVLPMLIVADLMGYLINRKGGSWKQIVPMIPAAIVGVIAGWLLLDRVSAAILGAGSSASDSLVLAARAAARGSSWPSPARAAASARPATAATWPRRPRILSITSSRRCPCGSG